MTASVRYFLAAFTLLLATAIQFMAVAFMAVDPEPEHIFLLGAITHYSGLAFGAAVFPRALSFFYAQTDDTSLLKRMGGLFALGIILFLPVLIRFLGFESMQDLGSVCFISLFAVGMIAAPVYCLTFNHVPRSRHGVTFGCALSIGLAICRFCLPSERENSNPLRLEDIFYLQSAFITFLSILITILLIRNGKTLFLQKQPPLENHTANSPVFRQMIKLLGATFFFYLLNGLLNGILFPTLPDRSQVRFHALNAAAIVFCPLFGLFLDKVRQNGAKTILLICSFLFMLSPALALSDNSVFAHQLFLTMETFAQYAFYITTTVILASWATGPWFCVIYTAPVFLRIISIVSVLFFNGVTEIGKGETVLAALCAGIILYLLIKDIHDYDPETMPRGESEVPSPPILTRAEEQIENADNEEFDPILSPRENEVAALLIVGAATREIAETLSISENTVKVHVKNILEKYHLPNRKAFIARMIASQERMPPPDLLH